MQAKGGIVRNCLDSRLHLIAFRQNEEERTHAQVSILCPLPYVWRHCQDALRVLFRRSTLRTSHHLERKFVALGAIEKKSD
jgi:hypothetical protein